MYVVKTKCYEPSEEKTLGVADDMAIAWNKVKMTAAGLMAGTGMVELRREAGTMTIFLGNEGGPHLFKVGAEYIPEGWYPL